MDSGQKTGCAASLSILAAIGSYIAVCSGYSPLGLLLALAAIPLGLVGLVMAASPRVSGGLLSILAMILGAIGVVFSILGMLGAVVF